MQNTNEYFSIHKKNNHFCKRQNIVIYCSNSHLGHTVGLYVH